MHSLSLSAARRGSTIIFVNLDAADLDADTFAFQGTPVDTAVQGGHSTQCGVWRGGTLRR